MKNKSSKFSDNMSMIMNKIQIHNKTFVKYIESYIIPKAVLRLA